MDYDKIRLVLYRRRDVFEDLLISPDSVEKYDYNVAKRGEQIVIKFNKKGCNSYFASAYVNAIITSDTFHDAAFHVLLRFCKSKYQKKYDENWVVLMKLLTPKYQFVDIKWNERINNMLLERQNIEYAMSWLSTLGGAFSALGDSFEHCAEMAGKISIEQFKLALQLGDPSVVARCKLYAALSLIQRNELNYPKVIILEVFNFAKEINDIRLQRMSQGIWVKLRYQRYLRKQKNKICKLPDKITK